MGAITMLEKNWGLPMKYVPSSKCYKAKATSKYHYFGTKGKTLCGKFDMKIYKPNYFTGTKADLEKLNKEGQLCSRCYKIMQQTKADLELALELSTLDKKIKPKETKSKSRIDEMIGKIVTHHSGRAYKVIGVATHTENQGKLVIYKAMYEKSPLRVKPIELFLKEVDLKKYPQSKQKYVFELSDKLNI